jgi:hypothetical protein
MIGYGGMAAYFYVVSELELAEHKAYRYIGFGVIILCRIFMKQTFRFIQKKFRSQLYSEGFNRASSAEITEVIGVCQIALAEYRNQLEQAKSRCCLKLFKARGLQREVKAFEDILSIAKGQDIQVVQKKRRASM